MPPDGAGEVYNSRGPPWQAASIQRAPPLRAALFAPGPRGKLDDLVRVLAKRVRGADGARDRSPVLAVVIAAMLSGGSACRRPAPVSPAPPPSADGGAAAARPPGPVDLARCVLQVSDSQKTVHRIKRPGGTLSPATVTGTCSAQAECSAEKGKVSAGDGAVSLACEGRACRCTIEPLAPPAAPSVVRFAIAEPCTGDQQARALFQQHCLDDEPTTPPEAAVTTRR